MSKKRSASRLPEPPWSYAPSEVAEWMASTGGPKERRESRPRRQVRVKALAATCPISSERRLLRRLNELGFKRGAEPHPAAVLSRLTRAARPDALHGTFGGTRVRIHLRRGPVLELHAAFSPRLTLRRASKLLERLGLRSLDVTWT